MLKLAIFVLLSVFGARQANAISYGSCVDSPIIKDFDASRYVGYWYEVERSNVVFEQNFKCVTAKYGAINSTFVSVENRAFNTKTSRNNVTIGYAYVPNPDRAPNKLLVNFPNNPRSGKYNVWTTDYKTYSVVYSCEQIIPALVKFELIWILARQNTLDNAIVADLKKQLSDAGVVVSDFESTDHTNCQYKF